VTHTRLVDTAAQYYAAKLAQHGATPAGVDWNSEQSQRLRFEQFMPLITSEETSVCDYGCGYGALLGFLRARGYRGSYAGYDAADEMVREARSRHGEDRSASFTSVRAELPISDVTVASGLFNVRLTAPADQWREYMEDTVADLAALSRRGFAFNVLTSYSDADRQRADLYYADPKAVFDHCMRRWPRRVTLVHDYELFEFTVIVRL
jgi:SAM-dependent methyltransferase